MPALKQAPALLDVAIDLAGFRINIHVLMTLAAFALTASGAMGEGVLLLLLFAASHTAEERLTMRARRDLDAMNDLIPDTALVVPLDGVIVEGEAYLSVEHLTGEAAPALKVPGDEIAGGSITNDGALVIRVVLCVAAAILVLGPLLLGIPLRALGFMVAAAPCALSVTPLAYVVAVSACARAGVLVQSGDTLDALTTCRTIAFDKTGTLTTGRLVCSGIGKDLPPVALEGFKAVPGKGVLAELSVAGSPTFTARMGSLAFVKIGMTDEEAARLDAIDLRDEESGCGVMAALVMDHEVAIFRFKDALRSGAADALQTLRQLEPEGFEMLMLTGDRLTSAQQVAAQLDLPPERVYAGMAPEEKLAKVRELSTKHGEEAGVLMVGEGVNDAPALAAARVGAVVAERSSAISEAVADVILLQGGVESLPFLYAKARQTVRVVKQGIVLAMLTLLGSAIPAGLGIIPLWFTVLLHEGGTLLVCINALRILRNVPLPKANTDNFNDSARQHEEKATDLYPGEQRCRPSHPTHVDDMAQLLEATAKETADMAALDATAEYYATIYEEERRLLYQRGFPLETPYGSVGSEGKVN
eukprot:gene3903-4866_t